MVIQQISITVPGSINGHELLDFNYQRQPRQLVGSWSAVLKSGSAPFTAGDDFTVPGWMQGGIVTDVQNNRDGSWSLSGNDAGARLLVAIPGNLADGSLEQLLTALASHCGVYASVAVSPIGTSKCKTLITGSTCADAIVELAAYGGSVAYIRRDGTLQVSSPASSYSPPSIILRDEGTSIDTDGLITGASVLLTRRAEPEDPGGTPPESWWVGTTPDGWLSTESSSGNTTLDPE